MTLAQYALFALQLLYFFLPGYLANGSPPVLAKLPFLKRWNAPFDCGKTWNGTRILGGHKTWRGIIGGITLGGVVFLIQKYVLDSVISTPAIPYSSLPLWFGFLFAFGAIVLGDSGKSLFKRRLNIKPGGSWIPFDQIDYTLGAFLATFWIYWPGWPAFLFLIVVNALFSAVTHFLAGEAKLTKEKL